MDLSQVNENLSAVISMGLSRIFPCNGEFFLQNTEFSQCNDYSRRIVISSENAMPKP